MGVGIGIGVGAAVHERNGSAVRKTGPTDDRPEGQDRPEPRIEEMGNGIAAGR